MSLLSAHFEQIAISCQGIDSLPFPPPKIFTNALLSNHDITSLIRDTEAHERALFSVPPPEPPATSQNSDPPKQSSRRQTVFNVASGEVMPSGGATGRSSGAPRRHTAVSAVLGGDLHDQIRRSERGRNKDDMDVEILLKGAEKLCTVYPLPGAPERIMAQRAKYAHNRNTLAYYEAKVTEQQEALGRMNKDIWDEEEEADTDSADDQEATLTEDDLIMEEEEVRELDKKKRELQRTLKAMEKDLNGLYMSR
ncbi:DASH complex subunit Spc34 [Pseudomassariella vexata]|uniref:DASH complex subunit SPC34 n=1 Tax=Pseudomassariella vexata TaxID=1141098 RepID=A0A1Y2DHI5_9PEZI|nr:DASH complex subunit Spc34 [Pseudomassariella vexata]ORY58710.1 DASH complex subunit Spc34 [Pseudomassariella vexata]